MQTGKPISQLPNLPQLSKEVDIPNNGNLYTETSSIKGIDLTSVEVPHLSNKKWDLSYLVKNF
jgi:hypothetical protein